MFTVAVKTITVTEEAYEALKSMKEEGESFSEAILRIRGKRSLREFIGILSDEAAEEMEKAIREARREHERFHRERMRKLRSELNGGS